MHDYWAQPEVWRQHYQDLLREAENARLAKETRRGRKRASREWHVRCSFVFVLKRKSWKLPAEVNILSIRQKIGKATNAKSTFLKASPPVTFRKGWIQPCDLFRNPRMVRYCLRAVNHYPIK